MLIRAILATCLAAIVLAPPARAASSTTCACRTADGKAFEERILRHHRWACDYALGYVDDPANNNVKGKLRPTTQTCNTEEIAQFKVWLCMRNACTYPYSRATRQENSDVRKIELMQGKRRP